MKNTNWRDHIWFDNQKAVIIGETVGPGSGGHIRRGQIGPRVREINYQIPWAFVNMSGRGCSIWNELYWRRFHIIPRHCRTSCYKVCTRLQSVYELYHFYLNLMQLGDLEGWGGKAGIDVRWYTFGRYASYIYHSKLEKAQQCYDSVRDIIDTSERFRLLREMESVYNRELITIKKGCTEMQHPAFNGIPSDQWENHELVPKWEEDELHLDAIYSTDDATDGQPPWLHNKIVYHWCEYAHQTGDPTYRQVLGEDPFAFSEATYHAKKGGNTLKLVEKEVAEFQSLVAR